MVLSMYTVSTTTSCSIYCILAPITQYLATYLILYFKSKELNSFGNKMDDKEVFYVEP